VNESSGRLRYRLLILAAALLFSTGGAAIKAVTLTSWQVASFRSGIAAIFFLLVFRDARRGWSWRMLAVAFAYGATLVLFAIANRLTTSADAIFLQSTAPLYVLLLGPWLLRERVRPADLVYMAAVLAGMTVFFVGSESALATAPDPARGNLVAAISGVTYAVLLVGLRWLARGKNGGSAVATVALGNLLACVCTLPMALPVRTANTQSLLVLLYLGVVQIGVAYVCLAKAIQHVPAVEASTLVMLEPAMNPVFAWLVHGERPGPWQLAGGAVILGATLVNTLRQSR
jgi:DME family drug/metabolite transporter